MKIYFKNKAAKLKLGIFYATCGKCPFYVGVRCPFDTSTIVDCNGKGWWIGGESVDIFEL